jgi:apolipoprotein N-acyltransferase
VGFAFGSVFTGLLMRFLGILLGPSVIALLAVLEGAVWAAICAVAWSSLRRAPAWAKPFLVASAWVLVDWVRSALGPVGFTLIDLGYGLSRFPLLIQTADLGGVRCVSWLLIALCGAAVEAVRELRSGAPGRSARTARACAGPALLAVGAIVYGAVRLAAPETGSPLRVAIAQPAQAIPSFYERSAPIPFPAELKAYRGLLAQAGITSADLLMLPESGLSVDLVADPAGRAAAVSISVPLQAQLTTGCHHAEGPRNCNSVVILDPTGKLLATYSKRRLLGFGEYLPFREQLMWIYSHYPIRQYEISPGTEAAVFTVGERSTAPVICFESIFGSDVRRALRAGGEALAIYTNDGWFDDVQEARLHSEAAVLRAVENRVPVLRSATSSFSGLIDSRGRWVTQVGINESRAVLVEPHMRRPSSLFFLLGETPMVLLCLAVLLALPVRSAWARGKRASGSAAPSDEPGTGDAAGTSPSEGT